MKDLAAEPYRLRSCEHVRDVIPVDDAQFPLYALVRAQPANVRP